MGHAVGSSRPGSRYKVKHAASLSQSIGRGGGAGRRHCGLLVAGGGAWRAVAGRHCTCKDDRTIHSSSCCSPASRYTALLPSQCSVVHAISGGNVVLFGRYLVSLSPANIASSFLCTREGGICSLSGFTEWEHNRDHLG